MNARVLWLIGALALAAGACGPAHGEGGYGDSGARSGDADPNVFPAKPPPFSEGIFPCSRCHLGGEPVVDALPSMPHAAHLEKGLECEDCHFPDGDEADPVIPDFEFCQECHDDPEEYSERSRAYFDAARQADGTFVFPDRWKTRDVQTAHRKHLDAEVECWSCHGSASNEPFTKPRSVPLMGRCTSCHEDLSVASDCKTCHAQITEKQHTFELRHAEQQRGCLDCHNPDDRDTLRLANGAAVAFAESYRLCGQCHGPKLRDWKIGLHGKRTGAWNGRKEYLLCAHCHDPHHPRFPEMTPDPPPPRPEEVR